MTVAKWIKDRERSLKAYKEIIEAIDATILGRAEKDVSHYEIETTLGKRRLDKIPMSELLKTRDYYQREVRKIEDEVEREESGPASRQVLVRF